MDMQQILLSMGEEWFRYYVSWTYKAFICAEVKKNGSKDRGMNNPKIYCALSVLGD